MPGFLIPQTSASPLTITDVFVVASEAAMLALSSAQTGDVAVRTDINKSFILSDLNYSTLSSWKELLTPPDAVSSVDGLTGTVSLSSNYASTSHASTHTDGGSDEITLTSSQIPTASVNAQTGTSYSLTLTDSGSLVTLNNSGAITLTVPPQSSVSWVDGAVVSLAQLGAGQVTVTAGAGVTINSSPGLKIAAQYGGAQLFRLSQDNWLLIGNLSS